VVRVRVRPDLAIILVCAGLYVGAAAQARTPRGTALSVAVAAISMPMVTMTNVIGQAWHDFREGQRNLSATLTELERLRSEDGELRRTNQLLTAELAALRQGSRLLGAFPQLAEHAVVARVVARDIVRSHIVRLDRGSGDGVRLDAPVLAEGGLLGRVDRVQDHSCRVQLLSHPAAAAAARIVGTLGEALLMGGDPPRLTGLPPYTQVALGTAVLSTGSEGIYPPGLLLGATLESRLEGIFTVVPVQLAAGPAEVMVVLVLAPATRSAP
jgi:rod shape-determining protein MreC